MQNFKETVCGRYLGPPPPGVTPAAAAGGGPFGGGLMGAAAAPPAAAPANDAQTSTSRLPSAALSSMGEKNSSAPEPAASPKKSDHPVKEPEPARPERNDAQTSTSRLPSAPAGSAALSSMGEKNSSVPEPVASPKKSDPPVKEPEPVPTNDHQFADLLTGPGCRIPATELRAISLDQLGRICKHIDRRLINNGEVWRVSRNETGQWFNVDLTDPQAVNLYDACAKVIKPATEQQQLSLVEVMSHGPQSPDYFTSHWYDVPLCLCLLLYFPTLTICLLFVFSLRSIHVLLYFCSHYTAVVFPLHSIHLLLYFPALTVCLLLYFPALTICPLLVFPLLSLHACCLYFTVLTI